LTAACRLVRIDGGNVENNLLGHKRAQMGMKFLTVALEGDFRYRLAVGHENGESGDALQIFC
jgi:hypothetical protein